jgi:RNA polymerase sigma-70 factor (ECF subfamily)
MEYIALTMTEPAPAFVRTPPPGLPDALLDLTARMVQGDQSALGELYDRTRSQVYGLVLRILDRAEDAEEVTLDVYMKAWRMASGYSPARGSVLTWLMMMARSGAIDRIRSRNSQVRLFEIDRREPEGQSRPDPVAGTPDPEEMAAIGQWRRRVQLALSELPEEQRECLLQAFYSGLSHGELAEQLGLPLGTVKTRIRLGLIRLRKVLGDE